jgi:hypothetical protein
VTKGVSSKHQREDRLRLRRKRLQDAAQALAGAKSYHRLRQGRPWQRIAIRSRARLWAIVKR